MGQVGGNGSVVWQNQHRSKQGKFKCKDHAKLQGNELGLGNALEVWGRDEVPIGEIGTTPALAVSSELDRFQQPGYFLVRLRFDGPDATAVQNWFKASGSVPPNVRLYTEGASTVMAINVKAVARDWPLDNISWSDMPWEIRYDW
jgi:hypothetical protein